MWGQDGYARRSMNYFVAAVLAACAIPQAAAQPSDELMVGRFFVELVGESLKQKFLPGSADTQSVRAKAAPLVPKFTADGCEVLQWDRNARSKLSLDISRPGKYCLDQDYESFCSPFEHGCPGPVIDIRASNVDVDLRGHTVSASGTGVSGYGQNIRIHHGHIKSARLGVQLSDKGNSPALAAPGLPLKADPVFSDTGFVVESIQFSDVGTAIMVSGRGNMVRDNTISATFDQKNSSGAHLALLSYGPAARIERNTFRLSGLASGASGHAVYLRSADGTVVGNNNVRTGFSRTGTIGVGVSGTTGVVLESNTLDTEKAVELDDASSL